LGEEVAEDAAATALIRAGGLKVRLVRQPFPQPLGPRSLSAVWKRQLRWARLRRVSFPLCFLPEFLVGGLFPMAAVAALVIAGTWSPLLALAYGLAWYGSEAALCRSFGWPSGRRAVAAMLLRDLLLPALWAAAWFGNGFVWRGNAMTVGGQTAPATGRGRLHHALARTRDKARQKARALAAFRPS
jgi:ceramide glucosyltransferase